MNVFIITGATRGLGAALVNCLAGHAQNWIAALHRTQPVLSTNSRIINIHADLGDAAQIDAGFDRIANWLSGHQFDNAVLINNAAVVLPVGRFDELEGAQLAANMQINLAAPMHCAARFAKLTRGCARTRLVIHLSSGAARRPIAGWSAYCAAKAGLEMATRVAAVEAAADHGLSVCALAPGVIDTDMQAQVRGQSESDFPDVERFKAMHRDGVLRSADAVAAEIVALIEQRRFTNGGLFDLREMVVNQT